MASPASARLAGVVPVKTAPFARVSALCGALEDITKGGVCASLCVEASQKSVSRDFGKENKNE